MHKYARMIFKENITLWIPSIITISFLCCLVSLCFMHLVWSTQNSFISKATAYGLNLAEFKIIATTLYFIIFTLSISSLWLIGKATTKQLQSEFAQWRLLGATPKETSIFNLYFSVYTVGIGVICGAVVACPLSFWVLPKMNSMANGYQPFMVFTYHLSFLAIVGSMILSFLTCFISSALSTFYVRKAKPLDLFRSRGISHLKHRRIHTVLAYLCLAYTILLICTVPLIKQLNGGISAVYTLMFHIAISGMLSVFMFMPNLLRIAKRLSICCAEKLNLKLGKISVFAIFYKIDKNNVALIVLTLAFTLLTTMYLGFKVIVLAVFKTTGITEINISDSFAIALLVALVAGLTAFSIITLSFKTERSELAVMKSNGLSNSQCNHFVIMQAFTFTITVLFISALPILAVSLVGSLGLFLIGVPYFVTALIPYMLGFITVLSFITLMLWIPTRRTLNSKWIEAIREG